MMARRAPFERLIGARDELRARLSQHLDGDIVRHEALLDELPHEIEIGLRGGRETHLDFLESDADQHVEHAALAGGIHRLDQRLIPVPQIDAAPGGRRGDDGVGPGAVLEVNGREWAILGRWRA